MRYHWGVATPGNTMVLLLLLAACGLPAPAPAAAVGQVELRLVGPAPEGEPAPCGAEGGAGGAAVWSEVGQARPGRGVITWGSCGPEPSTLVLPPGSTLVLRNAQDEDLPLAWALADGRADRAVIVRGGERSLVLGADSVVTVRSPKGNATVVVAPVGGVTDPQGRASLASVPAGAQELHVLQPGVGDRLLPVRVPVNDRVVVELELRPPQL